MTSFNVPYFPDRQVPLDEMRTARNIIARMLDGGELLASYEATLLRQGLRVLDGSVKAAEVRETKQAKKEH